MKNTKGIYYVCSLFVAKGRNTLMRTKCDGRNERNSFISFFAPACHDCFAEFDVSLFVCLFVSFVSQIYFVCHGCVIVRFLDITGFVFVFYFSN